MYVGNQKPVQELPSGDPPSELGLEKDNYSLLMADFHMALFDSDLATRKVWNLRGKRTDVFNTFKENTFKAKRLSNCCCRSNSKMGSSFCATGTDFCTTAAGIYSLSLQPVPAVTSCLNKDCTAVILERITAAEPCTFASDDQDLITSAMGKWYPPGTQLMKLNSHWWNRLRPEPYECSCFTSYIQGGRQKYHFPDEPDAQLHGFLRCMHACMHLGGMQVSDANHCC
ncbi:hypothetical protein Anapl_17229 [Anas platyrhynchos]|uniref:Uncharacterized protein n=1 Tax=Anas platyrhynchos TaxID=8839 RepID=R0L203_ANAPL|nr:hypothetical protein Anapl_17229 [Anas platyrhynchos]